MDIDTMISHHFPLSAAPEVFGKIAAHKMPHQKIILHPKG
jgi:hypothetical protein